MKRGAAYNGPIAVILLAAGQSRRMKGHDKLLEPLGAERMLGHAAKVALGSRADAVFVALPPNANLRLAEIMDLRVTPIPVPDFSEGMGGSLRNAMAHIGPEFEAVIIALADMPEISPVHFDALIQAYRSTNNQEIFRATTEDGFAGHPVLFGRRFFESLAQTQGDTGAKAVINANREYVLEVPTKGQAARLDLDTPEAWATWRQSQKD